MNGKLLMINCDMGEWDAPHLRSIDDALMSLVDMSNIACGGHAGNAEIMQKTLRSALENNVKVGAHPGYKDRANFGRVYQSMDRSELRDMLLRQLEFFLDHCHRASITPFHIKAHGALYHACNLKEMESEVLLEVVRSLNPTLKVLVSPDSMIRQKTSDSDLEILVESFVDRRYDAQLHLVSRNDPKAVITEPDEALGQFVSLKKGIVQTVTGEVKRLNSQTACVHGDNPACLTILKKIRRHEKI